MTQEEKVELVTKLLENGLKAVDETLFGPTVDRPIEPRVPQPKFLLVRGQKITKCYHECPFFGLDGGPSPMMVCNHPSLRGGGIEAAAIISHPDCDTGFPNKCPLLKENRND